MNNKAFRKAFIDTLPVMSGYLVLGIGYGIVMAEKGFGIIWTFLSSFFIYAGSLEYALINLTTIMIRFLPFIVFAKGKEVPPFVSYLEKTLPYSVMAMLVVFCLKDVNSLTLLPTVLAVAATVLMHLLKRNTLLSIITGTAVYMLLIRL